MANIPGKTAKQIRDKRTEPSFKGPVEKYNTTQPEPQRTDRLDVRQSFTVGRFCESETGNEVPAIRSGTSLAHSPPIERIPRQEGAAGAEDPPTSFDRPVTTATPAK
jgi:hypothetical protein